MDNRGSVTLFNATYISRANVDNVGLLVEIESEREIVVRERVVMYGAG